MRQKLLFLVPVTLIFSSAKAQPLADYSRDTLRVTAQWDRVPEARPLRAAVVVGASPTAQMAPSAAAQTPTVPPTPVTTSVQKEATFFDRIPGVSNLLGYARKQLAARYRSGGTTPSGFDCSGFVRYCFTKFGVHLPHSSAAQASLGAKVDREFAQPGDLIFFNGHAAGGSRVGHVGIISEVVDNQIKFIHSACGGGVKFDLLNADYYRKRFVTIRRVANLVAQN